jgi:carbon-monoxide dehydrogenase catalytic subunit
METIHLKTVDPISQELLRSAAQRGIELPWERYEKLQPQDGFLRLGLSCPFGCMQGPCRIDPFGRGAQKGVCGLGRDEMVAGTLLRLCLQGAMDVMGAVPVSDGVPEVRFSDTLGTLVSSMLTENGQPDISAGDIYKGASMLGRSSSTCQELVVQSFRLSLLTLGFLEQENKQISGGTKKCDVGYTTVDNHPVCIGFSGQPSVELAQQLEVESRQGAGASVALVSLGEWICLKDRFMPIACTSGESELLVSSGAIHLLVAGPGTDPGLIELCREMKIPVAVAADIVEPSDVVQRARHMSSTVSQMSLFTDASQAGEVEVVMSNKNAAQMFGENSKEKIALIGGTDSPQMPLGQLPVELANKLQDKGLRVAGWGDAALWMIKNGSTSDEEKAEALILENRQGPLLAVKELAGKDQMGRLQGICFTGLQNPSELAMALGLAYLGCPVSVAAPIPIQGSQVVKNTMAEMVQSNGGELNHYDHVPQTKEVLEWFTPPSIKGVA